MGRDTGFFAFHNASSQIMKEKRKTSIPRDKRLLTTSLMWAPNLPGAGLVLA